MHRKKLLTQKQKKKKKKRDLKNQMSDFNLNIYENMADDGFQINESR